MAAAGKAAAAPAVTATICQHLGRPCPAAGQVVAQLTAALKSAAPFTAEDFEIDGSTTLNGCDRPCPAKFSASHSRIRVYCGVGQEAETEGLNQFADAIFGDSQAGFAAAKLAQRPCALVESRAPAPQQPKQHAIAAALAL
jgi:predicted metal-binding protein